MTIHSKDRQIAHRTKYIVITVQEAKHWTNITKPAHTWRTTKNKKARKPRTIIPMTTRSWMEFIDC